MKTDIYSITSLVGKLRSEFDQSFTQQIPGRKPAHSYLLVRLGAAEYAIAGEEVAKVFPILGLVPVRTFAMGMLGLTANGAEVAAVYSLRGLLGGPMDGPQGWAVVPRVSAGSVVLAVDSIAGFASVVGDSDGRTHIFVDDRSLPLLRLDTMLEQNKILSAEITQDSAHE